MTSRDRDFGRKYESGSSKRKKYDKRREIEGKLCGSLTKYFKSGKIVNDAKKTSLQDSIKVAGPRSQVDTGNKGNEELCAKFLSPSPSPSSGLLTPVPSSSPLPVTFQEDIDEDHYVSKDSSEFNLSDPYSWPKQISDLELTKIVKNGPVRISNISFPRNDSGRHFSDAYYTRKLINGELQDRRWLIYSKSGDAVFCFPCRLFSFASTNALGSCEGISDWKHLSEALQSHETSKAHKDSMLKWLHLGKSLHCEKTIDSSTQTQILAEQQRWKDLLQRLLAIVQFLASYNLAFRGHTENLNSISSGNFLGVVKLIARFDPTLRDHLHQVMDKSVIRNKYLGKNIQNELIELMASHVKAKIVDKILRNKYYSIILDCTRDIARTEQLCITLRTTIRTLLKLKNILWNF